MNKKILLMVVMILLNITFVSAITLNADNTTAWPTWVTNAHDNNWTTYTDISISDITFTYNVGVNYSSIINPTITIKYTGFDISTGTPYLYCIQNESGTYTSIATFDIDNITKNQTFFIPSSCFNINNTIDFKINDAFSGGDMYLYETQLDYTPTCSTLNATCTPCSGGYNYTTLNNAFDSYNFITDINGYGDITGWNTSCITNMSKLFYRSNFNQSITSWDVSSVNDMSSMFEGDFGSRNPFNQDISGWNISNLINMQNMFLFSNFNQDIGSWDTSSVTNMVSLFAYAQYFNQNISTWCVNLIPTKPDPFDVGSAFAGQTTLQPIWGTCPSSTPTCSTLNATCTPCSGGYNQTTLASAFSGYNFTSDPDGYGDITGWDTSCITNMANMFYNSVNFNQDIGNWNTSSVTYMNNMFSLSEFNQDISGWDVSNVTTMNSMFNQNTAFNQNISSWDTSSVTTMQSMFAMPTFGETTYGDIVIEQNLGLWNISSVVDMTDMFLGANISTSNYDLILNGWSSQNVQSNVTFNAGYSKYSDDVSRAILTDINNWTILDGGPINVAPTITSYSPINTTPSIYLGVSQSFSINASDVDNDTLTYYFLLDGVVQQEGVSSSYNYQTTFSSLGERNITAKVSDGRYNTSQTWMVNVIYSPTPVFNYLLQSVTTNSIRIDPYNFGESYSVYINDIFYINSSSTALTLSDLTQDTLYQFKVIPKSAQGIYGFPKYFNITTLVSTQVAPIMQSVSISPQNAYTETSLVGYCRATDVDSPDLIYNYYWYVNDVLTASGVRTAIPQGNNVSVSGLLSSAYEYNDSIRFSCVANDGIFSSNTLNDTITINNTPAEVSDIFLIRFNATNYFCNHTYIDADGDSEIVPTYSWYKNNIDMNISSSTVSINNFTTGDSVVCGVETGDGINSNVFANSTTLLVGDIIAPNLTIVTHENIVKTDSSALIEVLCVDDVGVAGGFPYITYTTPGNESKIYSLFYGGSNTYYRYILYNEEGTYTDVEVVCSDGNSNQVTENLANVYASVRESTTIITTGGGGGEVIVEPFRNITSFQLVPYEVTINLPAGSSLQKEFEVINNDIVNIDFIATIITNVNTPETYNWISFDEGRKTTTFFIPKSGGLSSNNKFVRYVVSVPDDTPAGTYYGTIEVFGFETTQTIEVEIIVTDGFFNTLADFFRIELFELPFTRESTLTGNVVGGEGDRENIPITIGNVIVFIFVTGIVFGGYFYIRRLLK